MTSSLASFVVCLVPEHSFKLSRDTCAVWFNISFKDVVSCCSVKMLTVSSWTLQEVRVEIDLTSFGADGFAQTPPYFKDGVIGVMRNGVDGGTEQPLFELLLFKQFRMSEIFCPFGGGGLLSDTWQGGLNVNGCLSDGTVFDTLAFPRTCPWTGPEMQLHPMTINVFVRSSEHCLKKEKQCAILLVHYGTVDIDCL